MKNYFPFFICTALLFSCNDASTSGSSDSLSGNGDHPPVNAEAGQAVKNFLLWYNQNMDSLDHISILNHYPPRDTNEFYSVNFDGTEQWLKLMSSSGLVSPNYISAWREHFRKCEENFEKHPANDGPPEGFDFDFIYNTQEDLPKADDIRSATIDSTVATGNALEVWMTIPHYGNDHHRVIKSGDKWLVDQ